MLAYLLSIEKRHFKSLGKERSSVGQALGQQSYFAVIGYRKDKMARQRGPRTVHVHRGVVALAR